MRAGKADTLRMTTAEDGTLGFFPEYLVQKSHEDYTLGQAL
jgi:hypothetical protein